ncbi:MAG: MBL fold metallo-hydrolase [Prevotellaceae bacterium]|nr:MBL fold metallo-hydrolase [Candidatus Faecinaster equi]
MIQIEYLPVNYYDAIFIRYDGNDVFFHNILIDGGDYRNATLCYTNNLKPRLQKIFNAGEVIDLWIITHIDDDHIGGLFHFVNDTDFYRQNACKLKKIWMNYGGMGDYKVHTTGEISYDHGRELRDMILGMGTNVLGDITTGVTLDIAGTGITVVGPPASALSEYKTWWNKQECPDIFSTSKGEIDGKENDYDKPFADFDVSNYSEDKSVTNRSSIAVVITSHERNLLFSADSCSSILKDGLISQGFVQHGVARVDVMHIPHHGSCRNTSKEFLDMIDCDNYVITGNGRNKYHLPDKETIARLKAANPRGFSLHFSNYNSTIEQIFENEKDESFNVCPKAEFTYE